MSASDDTDGLRPRYGCKFRLFSAHLELPGVPLCSEAPGQLRDHSSAQILLLQDAPELQKKTQSLVYLVESAPSLLWLLFVTACLQLNYDFRVVIVVRAEQSRGRRPALLLSLCAQDSSSCPYGDF